MVTSAGAYSATAPLSGSAWVMQVAAFKAAGAPSGGTALHHRSHHCPGGIIWQDKFDTAPNGQLTKTTADSLFAPTVAGTSSGTYARVSIVTSDPSGTANHCATPFRRASSALSSSPPDCLVKQTMRRSTTMCVSTRISTGVGAASCPASSAPHRGTASTSRPPKHRPNVGWSTRLMWHGRGDDGSRPFQGTLGPFPPGATMTSSPPFARYPCGISGYGWQTSLGELTRGVWHHIRFEVKLNTVGQQDGLFRVWIDGALRFGATNFDYRNSSNVHIQAVLWDIHRGGGLTPPSWVSSRTSYVDIANLVVTDLSTG